MAQRITIMIDETHYQNIKKIQARLLLKAKGSVSFSQVINLVIAEGLKKKY